MLKWLFRLAVVGALGGGYLLFKDRFGGGSPQDVAENVAEEVKDRVNTPLDRAKDAASNLQDAAKEHEESAKKMLGQ